MTELYIDVKKKVKKGRGKKMRWLLYLPIILFLFASVGCVNGTKETTSNPLFEQLKEEQEKMDLEIVRLGQENQNQEQKISELLEQIESLKNDQNEAFEEIRQVIYMNDYLLKQLPDISIKQGYILDINLSENGIYNLMVDFAEKVEDESAPNGFRIKNDLEEKAKIQVSKEVQVYTVDGAKPIPSSFDELSQNHNGLYNLYFTNNKLVLVVEQYLP